ncbi:hypothetical protein hbim_06821 [Mycolicibacterium mageritense]|uniref:DUF4349 domain-containing protein n=2 Tax=Mycolicibacterium mageritense TaxID=53462 RepID=A0AAI8U1I8_MYCME|nr:hypothetical protein hbim_06821 [Mycolicibacterium mageritense]
MPRLGTRVWLYIEHMQKHAGRRVTVAVLATALLTVAPACAGGHSPSSTAPQATQADSGFAPAAPAPKEAPVPTEANRDVVKTASLSITAREPVAAADKAATITTDAGGRIDSRSEDAGSSSGRAHVAMVLRVPVAKLDKTIDDLKGLGTAETVEVRSEDVTATRVDLDARITALQTSVDRLLGIMRDAKDPEALIKAEEALSQRQADLDSLRAQRKQLGEQIDYSTVNLDITAEQVGGPSPQRYHGFFGQVERGWDALVAFASGAVMLFGLFLPWLAVLLVFIGVLLGIARLLKPRVRESAPRETGPEDGEL